MKNSTWQTIMKVIIAVASAILGAIGAAATQAKPMPVLPEVGSMRTPPGFKSPRSSASRIMDRPTRSLAEPAGFKYSSLASTRAWKPCLAP